MKHAYFGTLTTNDSEDMDVVWEQPQTLGSREVSTCLWAGQTLSQQTLDAFATHLRDLPALDALAREFLLAELTRDDEFMAHHLNHLAHFPALAAIAPEGRISVDDFVKAMVLTHVSLRAEEPPRMVMDYYIDPEHSGEILAVDLDLNCKLNAVDWDSCHGPFFSPT